MNIKKIITFPLLHNRSLLLLFSGELVSNSGSALTTLAGSILVYRLTGSALAVSLLLVTGVIPSLLIGLFAGVVVDRFDRRKIMIISDLTRALVSLLIPILAPQHILWLYGAMMLSSSIGQFFNPAHESVLPEIASPKELRGVNSLMAISGFGATTLGFALCGFVLNRYPLSWAFCIDSATYLVSAGLIWFVQVKSPATESETNFVETLNNLRDGVRFIRLDPALSRLWIVAIPVVLAFGIWNALLLPFSLRILHASSAQYGLQEGLTCAGFVVGSLLVLRLGDRVPEAVWMVVSFLGMGLLAADYALSTDIPLAIALVAGTGVLNAPYSIARRLIIQRHTHPAIRGRVNSAFLVTRDGVYLAGMASAALADVVGLQTILIASALLLVGAGLAVFSLHEGLWSRSSGNYPKGGIFHSLPTPTPTLPQPVTDVNASALWLGEGE